MSKICKTKKVEGFEINNFIRIKVENTQKINFLEKIDINKVIKELDLMSKKELQYRLNFEETNPEIIKLIKQVIKNK